MTLDKRDRGILLLALGMATEYEGRALQRCHALLEQQGNGSQITEAILEHKRVLNEFRRLRQLLQEHS